MAEYGQLIAYFPTGNKKYSTLELAKAYKEGGVDVLEISFPVEDAYYDGATVRTSMKEALSQHADIDWFVEQLTVIKKNYPELILEVFTYKDIFQQEGLEKFIRKVREAGADCALFPTLTDEEFIEYYNGEEKDFPLLKFLPFNATDEEIEELKKIPFKGYIFLQAVNGATGSRESLEPGLEEKIIRAKKAFPIPVCAGFGISKPEHSREMTRMGADGVIVGSLVVNYVRDHSLPEIVSMLREFKESLKKE